MAVPPLIFFLTSVALWRFSDAVFIPEMLAERFLEIMPAAITETQTLAALMKQLVFFNFIFLYFGGYFLVAFYWERLKRLFKNPFYAAFALWAVNLFVIFPLGGRGVLGYKLPQGPISASIFMLASHWIFARMMQWQMRRSQSLARTEGESFLPR